jgi:predicted ATP-grasp superfamily ATP-dependent carboligase
MKKGVIVIGGHVQGLGILRIFGRNEIPCYLLDSNSINIAKHSMYCTKFIKYNPDDDFIDYLIELHSKYNLKEWLLLPTDDYHVQLLSKNKKLLERYYHVAVDEWEIVEKCYNKRITYQIAKDLGIDIPKTFFPNSIAELEDIDIDFPCIIKPAIMHKLYSQIRKKVFVCDSKEELVSNFQKALEYIPSDEIIVQEIIPGDNTNQYSACFFFDRTEPLITFLVRRRRQYPIEFGSCASYVETIPDVERHKYAEKILKEINFFGICEVEFKKDPRDGIYKFFEINPRTWKQQSITNKSNSPLLMCLYNYIYSNEPITKNTWDDCCWKDIILDSFVIVKMLLKGMKVDFPKHKKIEYAVLDTKDPLPFIYELIYAPYLFLTR